MRFTLKPKLNVVDNQDYHLAKKDLHDQDLLNTAKREDKAAFKSSYGLHFGRVYGLCLRLCADMSFLRLTVHKFIRVQQF